LRVGVAWECPWVPSSYGKLSLWLAAELQRIGFEVRIYCPSAPELTLYSNKLIYAPHCIHRELGVCVELEKPVEVYSDKWLCEDGDVDVYAVCGSPYGEVESRWVSKCSTSSKPVAGYFVTESAIVPPILAQWLLHVDAVGFPAKAVARAYLVHDAVREVHGEWVLAPHGLPEYYFELEPDEVVDYGLRLYGHRDPGVELALESRRAGALYATVAKNHPRKDFGAVLSALAMLKARCRQELLPGRNCLSTRLLLGVVEAAGAPVWNIDMAVGALGLERDILLLEDKFRKTGVSEFFLVFMYSLANSFLFATLGEGFGLPPVEAGAFGRPAVITRTPVTEEVWEGYPLLAASRPVLSPDGFVLYSTDYADFAGKAESLLYPDVWERASKLARGVAEKYTARRMAEGFAKLVELAAEKRGTKQKHPLPEYRVSAPGYAEMLLELLGFART